MLELNSSRKNKVNLADYPCSQDIENRMLMSDFSVLDVEVLEAILFSPLKISQKKLARSLLREESELSASLKKFAKSGLITVQDDAIVVDKEKRKYFESQIQRFDPNFKPDMEFLQSILKKVPIHILPNWYSIPRTSNNIFESIVEKYLLTPAGYQRYLQELNLGDSILNAIVHDVYNSPEFKVSSTDLISKYNLKRRDFEEMVLTLEFNFVACLCFEKEDDHWLEVVTPFYEWKEFLRFLRSAEGQIIAPEKVTRSQKSDFAFIDTLTELLQKAQKKPLVTDFSHPVQKLCLVHLAEYKEGKLIALKGAQSWLELKPEEKALHLYRHPHNRILSLNVNERFVREAEKSVKRVLHGGWVFFDDFIKGVLVSLNEESVVSLKKFGKQWKYTLPVYGEKEITLLKATLFEWLTEMGIVVTGIAEGKECFALTHFGRFFFDD